jgi:hypothetical protein
MATVAHARMASIPDAVDSLNARDENTSCKQTGLVRLVPEGVPSGHRESHAYRYPAAVSDWGQIKDAFGTSCAPLGHRGVGRLESSIGLAVP